MKKATDMWHYYENTWPNGPLKGFQVSQRSIFLTLRTAAITSKCSAEEAATYQLHLEGQHGKRTAILTQKDLVSGPPG